MDALTDHALMKKVQQGDLNKMGLLYERHKRKLFGYFYHMNGDAALSEDLVQNVFVRLINYRNTYTGEGSFASWMYRTARNLQIDQYKKKARRPEQTLDDQNRELPDPADHQGQTDRADGIQELQWALGRLPSDMREILVLSKLKGMNFREIGQLLGCTEGAAKVRAHRALKELRTTYLTTYTN